MELHLASLDAWLLAKFESVFFFPSKFIRIFCIFAEQKEHKELIPLIRSSSSPCTIRCHTSNHISSQHKRKLRSLVLCPVNDQLFATR